MHNLYIVHFVKQAKFKQVQTVCHTYMHILTYIQMLIFNYR